MTDSSNQKSKHFILSRTTKNITNKTKKRRISPKDFWKHNHLYKCDRNKQY